MKPSTLSPTSVYAPRRREECKRDAAFPVGHIPDVSYAEESALALSQVITGSTSPFKTLYLRRGSDGVEKLSLHAKWWDRWTGESQNQELNARLRVTNNLMPLTRHCDLRVQQAAQNLLTLLDTPPPSNKAESKQFQTQLTSAFEALGEAVVAYRFDVANGVVKQGSDRSSSSPTDDEETSFSDNGETSLSDESQDETSSSEESQASIEFTPPATTAQSTQAPSEEQPRAIQPHVPTALVSPADAAAMATRLREMNVGSAPCIEHDSDYGRARFLQLVHGFALNSQKHSNENIRRTAAVLLQHVVNCAHNYSDLKSSDAPLLEALDAFATLGAPAPMAPAPATQTIPVIVLSPEITMDISEAINRLTIGQVITLTVDEENSLSVGSRPASLATDPATSSTEDRQAEHNFSQALLEIASFYRNDSDPEAQRYANKLWTLATKQRAVGQGITLTNELKHDLSILAQRENEKVPMSAPAETAGAETSAPANSPSINAVGRVLPSGIADIPAQAVQAISAFAQMAQDESVLTLDVEGQDLLVASTRFSYQNSHAQDQPLEASFRQALLQLARFYAKEGQPDVVRFCADRLEVLVEASSEGVVVTAALREVLQVIAIHGNPTA